MSRSRCAGLLLCGLLVGGVWTGCGKGAADFARGTSSAQSRPVATEPAEGMLNRYQENSPKAPAAPVATDTAPTEPTRGFSAPDRGIGPGQGGDKYAYLKENDFIAVRDQPLSTFSIDVDTASYSKTRMYLMRQGVLPPVDAVRIEEFVNYFDYSYAPPTNGDPFAMHVEVAECPWRPGHQLARVALKGREVERDRPPCNLVFLIDVSGSMASPPKIGLVKQSLRMLTSQLTARDSVAMVVYAGSDGLVLPATEGDRHAEILEALERLEAGGSTNGGAGIQRAYAVAKERLIQDGVNRVILCTDGDFNVGITSTGDLVRLAETESRSGVFLTVLGFGMGNHNDAMLEEISDKANGAYAFIDNDAEAKKVFIDQINSTLVTIAKDVKIQIEFNPVQVAAYRLIGYENRLLQAHEFNDDRKDAGEVGAGHTITAFYEIVPAGADESLEISRVDPLKYQQQQQPAPRAGSDELLTLKLRYKDPEANRSKLLTTPVRRSDLQFSQASTDFRFAACVAAFGMLLRQSQQAGDVNFDAVLEMASTAVGTDRRGYRGEFLQMVQTARKLSPHNRTSARVWTQPTLVRVAAPVPLPMHYSMNECVVAPRACGLRYLGIGILAFFALNLGAGLIVALVVGLCIRGTIGLAPPARCRSYAHGK